MQNLPSLKVLLIEDNPGDVLLLRAALETERLSTFDIITVELLEDGLRQLRQTEFDIVLVDLGLPDSHGFATFERLHEQASGKPIVVFSGNDDEQQAIDAVRAGAQDYLVKSSGGFEMAARTIRYAVERQKNEKKLRESEQQLKALVDSLDDIVFEVDQHGTYLNVWTSNDAILFKPREEVIGSRFDEVFGVEASRPFFESLTRTLRSNAPQTLEYPVDIGDGSQRWFAARYNPIHAKERTPKTVSILVRDITEIKKAELQLQEKLKLQEQLEKTASIVPGMIHIFKQDTSGKFSMPYASPAIRDIYGVSPDEVASDMSPAFSRIDPQDVPHVQATIAESARRMTPWQDDFRYHHPQKGMRWFAGHSTPVAEPDGSILWYGIIEDITERMRADQSLRQRMEDLALINTLNDAVNHGESIAEITDLLATEANKIFGSLSASIYLLDRDKKHLVMQHYTMPVETIKRLEKLLGRPVPQIAIPLGGDDHFNRSLSSEQGFLITGFEGVNAWLADFTNTTFLPEKVRPLIRKLIPAATRLLNINSVITLPLTGGRNMLGVIELITKDTFDETVLERLQNVRQQLTEVILRKQVEQSLRESEEQYRGLAEASDAIIVLLDAEGRFQYLNEKAAKFQGVQVSETLGKTMHEILPKTIADLNLERVQEVVSTGQGFVVESSIDDGSYFRTSIQPIHDEDGKTVLALMSATDITALKKAEQELIELNRTLEERVRQRTAEVQDLYDKAPTGYHSLDKHGKFIMINQTELNWLGYTRDELIGKSFTDIITPASLVTFQSNFPIFKQRGWVQDLEFDLIRKDGSTFPVLVNAIAVRDESGNYVMSRTTLFDLTERKKAEDALRESRENLQYFFDSASDLIQNMDEKGCYQYVNNAWCRVLGYTREEAMQMTMMNIIDPSHHEHCRELLNSLVTDQHPRQLEVVFRSRAGEPVIVEGSVSSRKDKSGHISTNGIFRDITERKKAEESLRASEAELRRSRDELSTANAALEKAARLKDDFLASMSHELRTPLTGILGLSEALQLKTYGEMNDKQHNALKMIEDSGRHLLELINDILDLSKIEAGQMELQISAFPLTDLCQASLKLTKGMSQQKRQRVSYIAPSEPVMLRADARRVKQIIVNLLGNAIKFTPENGELGLEIQTNAQEKNVKLIVWDKGIGIKAEDLQMVFKPFTQIDSSLAREYSGTGLGLSLVQQLVELHTGSVEVESVFGEGSRFTVTLPWLTENIPADEKEQPFAGQSNPVLAAVNDQSPLIMIADDNQVVLEILTDFLEAKRYRVINTTSGIELLAKVAEARPDLMLVDIQMPGMDGLETIRRVRAHQDPIVAQTPIIALTALAMSGDRERCLDAGANEYMSKPVKLKEIVTNIQNLIGTNDEQTRLRPS